MKRHNKAIVMGDCLAFMVTPLPLVCGIVGEGWIRLQGRKMWKEINEHG